MPEAIEKLGNPALVEQVCNEILDGDSTAWEDIAGQEDAKRLVQELVVWPMLNPGLCTVRKGFGTTVNPHWSVPVHRVGTQSVPCFTTQQISPQTLPPEISESRSSYLGQR